MKCSKVERLLSPYLDRRLDDERHRAVQTHVGDCARCRTTLALITRSARALATIGPAEPSDTLARRAVSAAFAAAAPGLGASPAYRPLLERLFPAAWPTAAAAAAAALLLWVAAGPTSRALGPTMTASATATGDLIDDALGLSSSYAPSESDSDAREAAAAALGDLEE